MRLVCPLLPGNIDALDSGVRIRILKYVLKYQDEADALFHALGDPTRRRILERLSTGPATVSELAAPLPMSMPAVVSHLRVLEASGLVSSQKLGRVRTCRLEVTQLATVQDWIADRQRAWERRLDRLGEYLAEQAEQEKKEQK